MELPDTVNINTEMNYWPAALPECHEPLLPLAGELAEAGRAAARSIYRARGWTCHHNTDLWRIAVPVGKGHGDPKPAGSTTTAHGGPADSTSPPDSTSESRERPS